MLQQSQPELKDFELTSVVTTDINSSPLDKLIQPLREQEWNILHVGPYGDYGAWALMERVKPDVQTRLEKENDRLLQERKAALEVFAQQQRESKKATDETLQSDNGT